MICNKELLANIQPCKLDFTAFGDRVKGKVISNNNPNIPGMPKIENGLLVDGLNENLISIGQLCNQNIYVKFTKNKYFVLNTILKIV